MPVRVAGLAAGKVHLLWRCSTKDPLAYRAWYNNPEHAKHSVGQRTGGPMQK